MSNILFSRRACDVSEVGWLVGWLAEVEGERVVSAHFFLLLLFFSERCLKENIRTHSGHANCWWGERVLREIYMTERERVNEKERDL